MQMKQRETVWVCDGSFTVEASCVIPVILAFLFLTVMCTLRLHEKEASYFYNMGYAMYSTRRNGYVESVETTLEACDGQTSAELETDGAGWWKMEEIIRLQEGVIQK